MGFPSPIALLHTFHSEDQETVCWCWQAKPVKVKVEPPEAPKKQADKQARTRYASQLLRSFYIASMKSQRQRPRQRNRRNSQPRTRPVVSCSYISMDIHGASSHFTWYWMILDGFRWYWNDDRQLGDVWCSWGVETNGNYLNYWANVMGFPPPYCILFTAKIKRLSADVDRQSRWR